MPKITAADLPPTGVNLRLLFPSEIARSTVFAEIIRSFDGDVRVVSGQMDTYRDEVLGSFVVNIDDRKLEQMKKVLLKKGVEWQIIWHIIMVESVPAVVSGMILATITAMGGTAMAGAVGAKGLGAVALMYGYQGFNDMVMYKTVVILIIIVQFIQSFGNWIYKKVKQ